MASLSLASFSSAFILSSYCFCNSDKLLRVAGASASGTELELEDVCSLAAKTNGQFSIVLHEMIILPF